MNPTSLPKQLVAALVDLIAQAISHGHFDDAEAIIAAVRIVRPKLSELDTFDAWIALKRGQWADAIRILRNLETTSPKWQLGKALMALCQFVTGDATWRASANEVVDDGSSSEATGLVTLLLDPESATRDKPEDSAEDKPRAAPTEALTSAFLRA